MWLYRSSNGSNRLQTGPPDSDVRVIYIANTAEGLGYLYNRGGWVSWRLQRVEIEPVRVFRHPQWSDYPFKLAIKRRESGSLTATQGLRAYLVASRGISKLRVPELNLFAVVRQRIDGRHESYTHVEPGEPDAELFKPPGEAQVNFKGQMSQTTVNR